MTLVKPANGKPSREIELYKRREVDRRLEQIERHAKDVFRELRQADPSHLLIKTPRNRIEQKENVRLNVALALLTYVNRARELLRLKRLTEMQVVDLADALLNAGQGFCFSTMDDSSAQNRRARFAREARRTAVDENDDELLGQVDTLRSEFPKRSLRSIAAMLLKGPERSDSLKIDAKRKLIDRAVRRRRDVLT